MFWKKQMARKDSIDEPIESEYEVPKEEEKPLKPLFKKQSQEPQQEQQVSIITENQLIQLRLNEISAKLDEILNIAKQ
jgi:hypothetical protein